MTSSAYRCVECSRPAHAGQLLCSACEARASARKQPFGQPPVVAPPTLAPQAYDLSSGAPAYQPNAAPPVNPNTPSQPSVQPPFNLQGNGPAPVPPYQPNSVPPPPIPGWQHSPDPLKDPNVLLNQLKQVEGSKPGSNRRMTRLERLGLRMAIRFGLAIVIGLGALAARLGQHSGQSAVNNDTPESMIQPTGRARTMPANNGFASTRNTMNALPPLMVQSEDRSIEGLLLQINAAWEDAKRVMDEAQTKLETSAGRADMTMYVRQLEQDRQTIAQNMPMIPQVRADCQQMTHAILEAEAVLANVRESQSRNVTPSGTGGVQMPSSSVPNPSGNPESMQSANGGNPPAAQPNAPEPSGQSPVGNTPQNAPSGGQPAAPNIPGSSEPAPTAPNGGQPNGSPAPPSSLGGSGGQ